MNIAPTLRWAANNKQARVLGSSRASSGRGTGFAGPQAGRPPRGVANHTKWGAWGQHV